jgi:hypothetical protein
MGDRVLKRLAVLAGWHVQLDLLSSGGAAPGVALGAAGRNCAINMKRKKTVRGGRSFLRAGVKEVCKVTSIERQRIEGFVHKLFYNILNGNWCHDIL